MDVSDASYYIQKLMKQINENKDIQMGHTKKIKKNSTILNNFKENEIRKNTYSVEAFELNILQNYD
jgi:hypothetical protein